jgi:hypothetical protein
MSEAKLWRPGSRSARVEAGSRFVDCGGKGATGGAVLSSICVEKYTKKENGKKGGRACGRGIYRASDPEDRTM